ncbi:YhfG family protein [Candidatus Methylobacter oryzae]|uniref:DUF2559 family protein n=1 Tax=Candidatus Methylobacter oryzae TaxID=2497749 RepID=A0ABY3C8U9_9GAMM|nr:YhfG family protein [Candidatus Methylobacter oryzae]TRW93087.1 DUF2559 family protein [Candidatus Methylobacter oryzae]
MQEKIIKNTSSILPDLNKIKDIETLKSFGSYAEVRLSVEKRIGIRLKSNSWQQLLKRISGLSLVVNNNIEKLIFLLDENKHLKELGSFHEAKKKISTLLGVQIKARSWKQLEISLKSIVVAFRNRDVIDKSAIFETNKIQNFIHSSRLEGIQLNDMPALKMADVIDKYRIKQ